jgi:hypothetical protein
MTIPNEEFSRADRLERASKAMQEIHVARAPEEVIRSTAWAMRAAARRSIWRRLAVQGTAAAVIALAVLGFAIVMSEGGTSLVLAEVAEQVKATKSLRAVVVNPNEGGTLFISGTRKRYEGENAVLIADSGTGEEVMLDTKNKLAYRLPNAAGRVVDFYGLFRNLAREASKPIDEYVDQRGQRYPGFAGTTRLKIGDDETLKVDAKVWSDPETKLPVRVEIRPAGTDEKAAKLIDEIEFDVRLDDDLFDMTIPAGYTVVGLARDQLKPPPNKAEADKLTIVPGVGIGAVKFGMSRKEIVAILGEPEVTLHDTYLGYLSKGLQLALGGDELGMIIANPSDAASLVRNEFPGQTEKGIRIGSSWEEVLERYGEPDPPLPSDRGNPAEMGFARYEKLGLMFSFANDKVAQIFASRID